MPQRQFWTSQHACTLSFTMRIDPVDPDKPTWAWCEVQDQAGARLSASAGSLPPGFAAYAMRDAVTEALEAWEAASPADATRTFKRSLERSRYAARHLHER